jgi:hypothetical protein
MWILFFALLRLSLSSGTYRISNRWMELELNNDCFQGCPGSIVYLMDMVSGRNLVAPGQDFSAVRFGDYRPSPGDVFCTDTSAVFISAEMSGPRGTIPVSVSISYTLVGRGLEIIYGLQFLQNVEVADPLEAAFRLQGWDQASVENQSGSDDSFPLDGSTGFQRFSGSQMLYLSGGTNPGALFLFPLVPKGIFKLEDSGCPELRLLFFDTESPRENCQGPDLHSMVPGGESREYFAALSLDPTFRPVFVGNHPCGYERTAAWIMDELPFIHPEQGDIWSFSETADGPEPVSASLIRLLERHQELKMDWLILPDAILTPNRDSAWAEPGWGWSWSHWHCTWRISSEASLEYMQWLRNIQNRVYPWSERITMGSHGYHHTPNADSSYGGYHEFITYEPWEHEERFTMSMADISEIGLDTNLVDVVRFPGHRTSLSGLWAVIDHGFRFYCNGWRLIDWFAGEQFRNQWITMFQTPRGRIWGSNTVWWADLGESHPYAYVTDVLDRGKFALLGTHPISMLAGGENPGAYHRIDSVLTSMEEDYAHFGWLLPIEYGSYLEDCYQLNVREVRNQPGRLSMSFNGEIPSEITFCACLSSQDVVEQVTLDGLPLEWETREGNRLFAVSGPGSPGDHVLEIHLCGTRIDSPDPGAVTFSVVSPSMSGSLEIQTAGLPPGEPVYLAVYDLSGRAVYCNEVNLGSGRTSFRIPGGFPCGMYMVRATIAGRSYGAKAVLLH